MKTLIIDLDSLTPELFKEVIGFTLRVGLNFRKIDLVTPGRTGQNLVVEIATRGEDKAFTTFLTGLGIASPIVVKSDNKAVLNGKKLGKFTQVSQVEGLNSYYLDRSTGKKFAVIQGEV